MRRPVSLIGGLVALLLLGGQASWAGGHLATAAPGARVALRGGSIVPAGTIVPLTIVVRPAGALVGDGGDARVVVRGVRNADDLSSRVVGQRLRSGQGIGYSRTCRRSPCRVAVRSRTNAVWEFQAFVVRGGRIVASSNRMRSIWHSACRLTGDWAQTPDVIGSSTWSITAGGVAAESGLGGASGTAQLTRNVLRIDWTLAGGWAGRYQWTLDDACAGVGELVFTAGPRLGQTFRSTVRRV